MARPLLSDELWSLIEPLLPVGPRRFRYPGRKPLADRQVMTGILFVLKTGIPWERLPQEMGCGSGMTCWRRLRDWQQAGVWQALHEVLLAKLNGAEQIDWSRAVVDASYVRCFWGLHEAPRDHRRGRRSARLPAQRRQPQRRHLADPARRSDPSRARKRGRPRQRPKALLGDRGYDAKAQRAQLRARGIRPRI
jgi:transposase